MRYYRIAVIPGDGIGKEITPEGVRLLEFAAEVTGQFKIDWQEFPWGSGYYLEHGVMMPADGLDILEQFDAIYFGAVGWPEVPDHITLWGLRLPICQGFEQYANVRPAVLLPGVRSPLRDQESGDIDFVVVRENTEGEYAGIGGRTHQKSGAEIAMETSIFTRKGVDRVMRYAFGLAQSRGKKLSCVTKSNAQRYGFVLWDEVFKEVAAEFPEIETEKVLVDAMAAQFVLHPGSLDVVVASNLHGDILTDLGGAIVGSLGMAPSGNINPERDYPSMFEPIHGSAPDIYGKSVANPYGMFLSGSMMLDFLGEKETARLIQSAANAATSQGILTPDVGGNMRTAQVTKGVLAKIREHTDR
jgi:tartrate dehydrogenase/decarboxylase/D-malate dehydrogenase